ncbi:MAG: CBS domain-containing protein [Anaerolineaceae bacterium]|nr:CBS domain-containing protein [Anaerolineaceae bacterium]
MKIILTHDNADFDAVAALLAAWKLDPEAIPILPERLNQNVAGFMTLYQGGLPFTAQHDFRPNTITHITLVDTQRPVKVKGVDLDAPMHIIDHHERSRDLLPNQTFVYEAVGATTTILVEQIRAQDIRLNTLEATLLLLGIYEDTGSLLYGTTTPRDIQAAGWLLEQQAALDTVRRFLSPALNDEQQALYETLIATAENRTIQGHVITVGAAISATYISQVSSVAHRLRDTLETTALFVAVDMPGGIQMVCRSSSDAVDVGAIARVFGGGGHARAAAAAIYDKKLDDVVRQLWEELFQRIRPAAIVADLMSYSVQTVEARRRVMDELTRLRRIGHEGYPVIEGGKVVGLLTRRDVDHALEHGLETITVREIMSGGAVTLTPDDSVMLLEQRMVNSGWGQIPVVDSAGKLLGIVTRTDLIKHWAQIHPAAPQAENIIPKGLIAQVQGEAISILVNVILDYAQETSASVFMVGGAVRDLLLRRRNLDLDFVIEGNAIQLAENLRDLFGGTVSSFQPFGTAKWKLDEQVAAKMGVGPDDLPEHIDFATARNEFYEHPTALPTTYHSSIKLDLQRRDFTINTLAVQLSPRPAMGRILDFYGGLHDLQGRLIRVLHSLSFVDDPTRILRAVRFEHRLGFTVEPRTAELIETALPMLGRITGERVRNELHLLFKEDAPENALLTLHEIGALKAIHPAFVLDETLPARFEKIRRAQSPWSLAASPKELYWHAIACTIPLEKLPGLCNRLVLGQSLSQSVIDAAQLVQQADYLADPLLRPSQIDQYLASLTETAIFTGWLFIPDETVRENIRRYMLEWRTTQPETSGHTLREMGLKPGPCYARILSRLRAGRLDGEITTSEQERLLVESMVREEDICAEEE